jgi:hypothetical protein
MSFPNPPNPYAASTAVPPAKAIDSLSGQTQLEYMRAIHYIFENPNWVMNAVWAFLAHLAGQFIPILPQMVFMGYQFEILDSLMATRGTRYPDFDVNRIGDYLGRGVWAMLAVLVTVLGLFAMAFVVGGMGAVAMIGVAAAVGEDAAPFVMIPGMILFAAFGLVMMVGLSLITTPIMLRGGMTQDFGAAFDIAWIKDFLGKMWKESVLSTLFVLVSALVLTLFTCFLGAFLVIPVLPFVQAHFLYQLYTMYLLRGGTPIPVKTSFAQPMTQPPGQYPHAPPQ